MAKPNAFAPKQSKYLKNTKVIMEADSESDDDIEIVVDGEQ